jgi:hypothetical protein
MGYPVVILPISSMIAEKSLTPSTSRCRRRPA